MYHIINVLYSASAHAISHAFYCCLKFNECFLCEWHFSLLVFCNLFETLLLQAFYVSSSTKHVCCIPHIRFFFFFATNSTAQKPPRIYKYICESIACMHDAFHEYKKEFKKVRESWLQYLEIDWKWIKGFNLNCFWIVFCSNYLKLHWNMASQ